ncbi:MAG: hypothetical protein ACI841_005316 [Planctomycetota bacterium]|jgi:hypothetical protein
MGVWARKRLEWQSFEEFPDDGLIILCDGLTQLLASIDCLAQTFTEGSSSSTRTLSKPVVF